MKPNKVFSLLGLATRAGRTASGEFMTEKSVKNKTAALVIVGTDASANTKKNFRDMCSFYPVSYTHLRAHETDSYLVCRLLLEKKKNTLIHISEPTRHAEISYAFFFLKKHNKQPYKK